MTRRDRRTAVWSSFAALIFLEAQATAIGAVSWHAGMPWWGTVALCLSVPISFLLGRASAWREARDTLKALLPVLIKARPAARPDGPPPEEES